MAWCDKNRHFIPLIVIVCLFAITLVGVGRVYADDPHFPDPDRMSLAEQEEYVLADKAHLVTETFRVPKGLKKRVSFWFKIYSQYSIEQTVIHDTENPWIIYDVVSADEIRKSGVRGGAVRRMQTSIASQKRAEYRAILLKLAKNPPYGDLGGRERRIYHLFDDLEGNRANNFKRAAYRIRLQLGQQDSLIHALRKSGQYWKSMEEVLAEENVPAELLTISLLESSFVVEARSQVGAAGVWQFMRKTGTYFLNYVRSDIDERYDPLKASRAAAKLFKQNLKILKAWPLAVNAYNTGPGPLLQAKRKFGTDDISTIINRYSARGWGFASRNYYSMFLAAAHVTRYYRFLLGDIKRDPPLKHDDEIDIKYPMRAFFVIDLCKVTKEELQKYNPDLRHQALNSYTYLPDNYRLKLPVGHRKYLEEFHREVGEVNAQLDKWGVPKD